MTLKRAIPQIRFWMYLNDGYKRCEYAREKNLFAYLGKGVQLPMSMPLYPQLVRIHNNVIIHHSVKLITHDRINSFLNAVPDGIKLKHPESLNPIEIMDNVYIGMNVIINGNVRIGPNVIINAGSVVSGDIPPNSIVAGAPAKVIGSFDIFMKARALSDKSALDFTRIGREAIDATTAQAAWEAFDRKKNRAAAKLNAPRKNGCPAAE